MLATVAAALVTIVVTVVVAIFASLWNIRRDIREDIREDMRAFGKRIDKLEVKVDDLRVSCAKTRSEGRRFARRRAQFRLRTIHAHPVQLTSTPDGQGFTLSIDKAA